MLCRRQGTVCVNFDSCTRENIDTGNISNRYRNSSSVTRKTRHVERERESAREMESKERFSIARASQFQFRQVFFHRESRAHPPGCYR